MRLELRGGIAIFIALAALAVGTWFLWAVGTNGLVLYLAEAAPRAEGSSARTLRQLEWARNRLPTDDRVLRSLAQAHLNESTLGDRDAHRTAAIEALKAASAAAPFDARLDYAQAWLYLDENDLVAAERAFVSALHKDPVNPEYRYGLGRLREAQGDFDLAIIQYESALDLVELPKVAARRDYIERRRDSATP